MEKQGRFSCPFCFDGPSGEAVHGAWIALFGPTVDSALDRLWIRIRASRLLQCSEAEIHNQAIATSFGLAATVEPGETGSTAGRIGGVGFPLGSAEAREFPGEYRSPSSSTDTDTTGESSHRFGE
jgi:hypothetical protein